MPLAALTACRRFFQSHVAPECDRSAVRLHWAVVNALGIRDSDVLHASPDLKVYHMVAERIGKEISHFGQEPTIVILSRPTEAELTTRLTRLLPGNRLVAYNSERDLDEMPLRSFELATACLFDQDSKKVVRIFDAPPQRVRQYKHVELAEHSDSSLTLQASRIASLR